MANTVTKQFNGRTWDLGLDYIYDVVPYKVVFAAGAIYTAGDGPLPQRGDLHPEGGPGKPFEGAVVYRVRFEQWINKTTALVSVIYRRQLTGYAGGPRSGNRSVTNPEPNFTIPVIGGHVSQIGPPLYVREDRFFPRAQTLRTEVRFVTGSVSAVQQAIAANVGLIYTIDGTIYQFQGGRTTYDGVSYIRAEYDFLTTAPILAIPASPTFGNLIDIPALPSLYRYATNMDASPPTITAVPLNVFATTGGALPGFP